MNGRNHRLGVWTVVAGLALGAVVLGLVVLLFFLIGVLVWKL